MRAAKECLSGRGLGRKDLKVELRVGQRCCVREAEITMGTWYLLSQVMLSLVPHKYQYVGRINSPSRSDLL